MSKASDAYDNMDRDTKAALHDLQIEAEERKFRAAMTIPARERLVEFFKTLVGIDLTEHAEYLAGEIIAAFPEIGEDYKPAAIRKPFHPESLYEDRTGALSLKEVYAVRYAAWMYLLHEAPIGARALLIFRLCDQIIKSANPMNAFEDSCIDELEATVASLKAQLDEVREALRVFAEIGRKLDPDFHNSHSINMPLRRISASYKPPEVVPSVPLFAQITMADLRRAAAAMEEKNG